MCACQLRNFESSSPAARPFCRTHAPVLDCANGHQKENSEEVGEVEENCPQEDTPGEDGETSQEGREEETRSEEIYPEEGGEKENLG